MDILLYLLELIRIRKEIGINGLGTIYKKKSPGRYDTETHMFMPPSFTLAFTTDVKENDYLIQHIVQKRNISASAASYFINDFVAEIKKELSQGKTYELQNLGSFSLINDEIKFTPLKDIDFGFDFYALPPIDDAVKNENLNSSENETQTEFDDVTKNQEEIIDSIEQEENTELNNIVEEVKFEEHNPGDDVNTKKLHEETTEIENISNETKQEENLDTDEVYEEITEVDPQTIQQQTGAENDQLNFTDDNIVDFNSSDQEEEKQPSIIEKPINTDPSSSIKNTFTQPDVATDTNSSNEIKNWDFEDKKVNADIISTDEISDEEFEEKKSIPLYLKFLIAILVILVIGAAAYFVNPNIFNAFIKSDIGDQKIAIPIAADSTLKPHETKAFADSIVESAQKAGLQVDSARDTLKVITEAKPLEAPTYEVIAAAFKTQKEVNKYIETMKKKGIVAKEIPTAPGKLMKKISLATYNNPDSAKKNLEKLKQQLRRPELYIFVNKPR